MSLDIRRVRADEWRQLRALRLRALAETPLAFGSTLAREEAFSETVWQERAAGGSDRATFAAEQDGRWVGLATGLAAGTDDPQQAFPMLVGMLSMRRRGSREWAPNLSSASPPGPKNKAPGGWCSGSLPAMSRQSRSTAAAAFNRPG
jgi:hypothetical protein